MFKISILFTFLTCFVLIYQASGQTILENGKIPPDLLITYEKGRPDFYKVQINVRGEVYFKSYLTKFIRDGIDISKTNEGFEFASKEDEKKFKEKKQKAQNSKQKKQENLTFSQLRDLIKAFELIDFFNLEDRYPIRNLSKNSSKQSWCINPGMEQKLTFQVNGKSKTVENDLSCTIQEKPFEKLGNRIFQLTKIVKLKELKDISDED